jgi:hypothetical protein
MFDVAPSAEKSFLEFIGSRLASAELSALSHETGFRDPNDFNVERITQPLLDGEFPKTNHYEYLWALYECEFEGLRKYSNSMKMYLSAIYLYSNKIRQWGTRVESDFYYLVIEAELVRLNPDHVMQFLKFMEWLDVEVEADCGYDDYFFLLSWILLRRLIGLTKDKTFELVAKRLMEKDYARPYYLAELTVSERGASSWFELHQRIPLEISGSHIDYRKAILGEY